MLIVMTKKKTLSATHRANIGLGLIGRPCSEATREKLRAAMAKRPYSSKEEQREKRLARSQRYRAKNPDKILDYTERTKEARKETRYAYYERNKVALLAAQKERYQAKREDILAQQREYAKANAPRISAYNRSPARRAAFKRYDAENREERRLKAVARRKANPGLAYAAMKRYYGLHPEAKRTDNARRRARKSGAEGSHTVSEWTKKKHEHQNCCAYCLQEKTLFRDHDMPLARGGSDYITNILPACRSCNSAKGTLTAAEYRQRLTDGKTFDAAWAARLAAMRTKKANSARA